MLEAAVQELKQEIDEHDGANVVSREFARRYAAILKLEPEAFPELLKRLLPRGSALTAPSD